MLYKLAGESLLLKACSAMRARCWPCVPLGDCLTPRWCCRQGAWQTPVKRKHFAHFAISRRESAPLFGFLMVARSHEITQIVSLR